MIARVLSLCLALAACDSGTGIDAPNALSAGDESATTVNADGDYNCTGTVTGTFENVIVPPGATCRLQRADVKGNVLAKERATLYVSGTDVEGNVDGVEARLVQVNGGTIGGSIQIADGSSEGELGAAVYGGTVLTQGNIQIIKMRTGSIRIEDVRLEKGNIKVEDNSTSRSMVVENNVVAQNVQVLKNRGSGSKSVRHNTIGQAVQCKENSAPFTGTPNRAGDAEDKCA